MNEASTRFEYDPAVVRYGRGAVGDLDAELAEQGFERALVVCGSTVGATPAVMDPVREGLGDRLAGVFAETTPEKRLGTAAEGVDALREADADAIVSLGGGSSLDVAKVISTLAASDRSPADCGRELEATGSITVPEDGLVPIFAVPTTLAGADLTMVAGVTADPESGLVDSAASGGISGRGLMPAGVHYDPALFETTPRSILAASAMNGFDKAVETLYARSATPVTDATAMRALDRLAEGLGTFDREEIPTAAMDTAVEGILLAQYGISRPSGTTLSLIHAFGHALTRTYPVQQGAAHGVIAPHALEYLFEKADGRRDLLAEAFGVEDADDPAAAVVAAVADVRDALGLPTRLRDVDGPGREEFPEVARNTLDDAFMGNAPADLDPTVGDIEGVLDAAW